MVSFSPLTLVLLASLLLFFGTAMHLIVNADALAALFGKGRMHHAAPQGELVADPHGRGRRASREVIIASFSLHLIGLIGMVATVLLLIRSTTAN